MVLEDREARIRADRFAVVPAAGPEEMGLEGHLPNTAAAQVPVPMVGFGHRITILMVPLQNKMAA